MQAAPVREQCCRISSLDFTCAIYYHLCIKKTGVTSIADIQNHLCIYKCPLIPDRRAVRRVQIVGN